MAAKRADRSGGRDGPAEWGQIPEEDWPTNPGLRAGDPRLATGRSAGGQGGYTGPVGYGQGGRGGYGQDGYGSAGYGYGRSGYARPVAWRRRRPPGTVAIVVVSLFFGPFGAIPAISSARTARNRGLGTLRYWLVFLGVWALHLMALLLVLIAWLSGGISGLTGSPEASPAAAASGSPGVASPAASTQAASSSPAASQPASSSSSASPSALAFPAGSTQCSDHIAANAATSCAFAAKVADAYEAAGSAGRTVSVQAVSPITGQSYVMSCGPDRSGLVSCTGGNGAGVYLR